MELAVARKLVNAYIKHRNTVSVHQQLMGDPRYNNAEARWARLFTQAGPRPWPKHIQNRVNNANKKRLEIYANSVKKMTLARENLNRVKAEALAVFGPGWVNTRHLNVRPFVRLLETADAKARRILRKYMGTTMANKANARRHQRELINQALSFYTINKNKNNNSTIRPSNVKRSEVKK